MASRNTSRAQINLYISFRNQNVTIKWFHGTKHQEITRCICDAFKLEYDANLSLVEKMSGTSYLIPSEFANLINLTDLHNLSFDLKAIEHQQRLQNAIEEKSSSTFIVCEEQNSEHTPLLSSSKQKKNDKTMNFDEFDDDTRQKSFIRKLKAYLLLGLKEITDDADFSVRFSATKGNKFQGQYLKYERILAHLANERTFLAWERTALALLSISFSVLRLAMDRNGFEAKVTYFIGCAVIFAVPVTSAVGFVRYNQTKSILLLPDIDITLKFGSVGVVTQACLLGVILVLSSIVYVSFGLN